MKTFSAKPHEVKRDWYLIDATDKVLGRLAVEIARRLRGKHKAEFTPHVDTGDYIVVINAEKVRVTGRKAESKIYYRHSQYPGGLKTTNFTKLQAAFPGACHREGRQGNAAQRAAGLAMYRKLKVYAGSQHPHAAQQPKELKLS